MVIVKVHNLLIYVVDYLMYAFTILQYNAGVRHVYFIHVYVVCLRLLSCSVDSRLLDLFTMNLS